MVDLPMQVQLHDDGGYHIKLVVQEGKDRVLYSYALGLKAMEKMMTCRGGNTGGPRGTFSMDAWNCGNRTDCKVIAGGIYRRGRDAKTDDYRKTPSNPHELEFTSGKGFKGGKMIFKSTRTKTFKDSKFSGLYKIEPLVCQGFDVSKLEKIDKGKERKEKGSPVQESLF